MQITVPEAIVALASEGIHVSVLDLAALHDAGLLDMNPVILKAKLPSKDIATGWEATVLDALGVEHEDMPAALGGDIEALTRVAEQAARLYSFLHAVIKHIVSCRSEMSLPAKRAVRDALTLTDPRPWER